MLSRQQSGISLIEVLIALLIMTVALLGAAALQINALKYTDSADLRTKVSFVAYDMMDRIRANPSGKYALTSLAAAPTGTTSATVATQDLMDFRQNVTDLGGTNATIVLTDTVVYTITITWDDSRAGKQVTANGSVADSSTAQTFVLRSRVATGGVTTQ
ncbi:type IV pilus modification protein PilV [Pseudomonas japonica]|uniref:type IV pilus modification protein PilV n=1 Tax=Pseudomonas japonica TaxID=256466 RepID=UPI0015E27B09|nr:type IV pilus modification protein PilV [Pseudomonas japonica]MBA1244057.1 type IV pilus modification protein PilV [Pseudomonas japonica]